MFKNLFGKKKTSTQSVSAKDNWFQQYRQDHSTAMASIDAIGNKQGTDISMPVSKLNGQDLTVNLDSYAFLTESMKAQMRQHLENNLHGHQLYVRFPNLNLIESAEKIIQSKPYGQRTRYTVILFPRDNNCVLIRIGDWSLEERVEAANICNQHRGELIVISIG